MVNIGFFLVALHRLTLPSALPVSHSLPVT